MKTYDQPQETAAPLPASRQESIASPALFGAQGDAATAVGTGLANAGTGIDAIAVHMQTRDNLQKVQDASAAYGESLAQWQEEAKKNRTNAAAAGVVGDFSDWHQKTVADMSKALANDEQRRVFTDVARRTGLAARHDIATFELQQTRNADRMADDAMYQSNVNAGATALTPEAAAVYKSNLINSTRAYDAANNLDPEVTKARLDVRLTEFHAQRIQNLARTDPMAAKDYFEQNKNEIAGQKQAEIGKFADLATAEARATDAAGAIFATTGPAAGLDVMEEAARKQFKNDPITLKATIANLRERTAAFDKGQQERTDSVAASVNNAVMGGASPSQIRAMPAFISLSAMGGAGAKQANAIIEHAENRQYTSMLRDNAAEVRAQQVMQRKGFASYLEYSNPDRLAAMSENQITNLLPTLGNELTGHLMQQKRSLVKKDDKIIEARIDKQDFDTVAAEVGLRPYDPHKSEDEKAMLGKLQYTIENKIDAAQQAKKAPLTRQEKMQIFRSEMDNKVLVDEWGRDPVKPVSILSSGDLRDAYVNVDGQPVKLNSISQAERTNIAIKLRRAGEPVTEQAIAEVWVGGKGAKKAVTTTAAESRLLSGIPQ